MKRRIALLLALSSLLTLTACGKKKDAEETLMMEIPALTEVREEIPALTEAPVYTELPEAPVEDTAPATEAAVPTETEAAAEPAETEAAETLPAETETVPEETEVSYELEEGYKAVDETVYAVRNVNIRAEPGVMSDSPGKLPKGDSVKRVGISTSGWSAVIYDDQLYYIASEYLTTEAPKNVGGTSQSQKEVTETESKATVYANHTVNFRKAPSVHSKWLNSIPQGAELQQIAVCSNGWIKAVYKDQEGYVAGGYVTDSAPGGAAATEAAQEAQSAETEATEA